MSFEFLQHFRHGEENGEPLMQLPGFVDSHADEKDYELAIHLGRHTGTNYRCHRASSWPDPAIWDPVLFQNSIQLRSLTQIRCTRRLYAAGGAMELKTTSLRRNPTTG